MSYPRGGNVLESVQQGANCPGMGNVQGGIVLHSLLVGHSVRDIFCNIGTIGS